MISKIKEIARKLLLWRLEVKARAAAVFAPQGRVLILAPHPDDEVFGCGGLIVRLCAAHRPPHVVVLTGGGGSLQGHGNIPESDVKDARRILTRRAMDALGLPDNNLHLLDFKDGLVAECFAQGNYRKLIMQLIDDVAPDVILVPHHGEGWPDHLTTREIGLELGPKGAEIWEYCVWFWYYMQRRIDWTDSGVIKMTDAEIELKHKAIEIYHSALAPCGKPWIGVLPPLFINANSRPRELYFKIK